MGCRDAGDQRGSPTRLIHPLAEQAIGQLAKAKSGHGFVWTGDKNVFIHKAAAIESDRERLRLANDFVALGYYLAQARGSPRAAEPIMEIARTLVPLLTSAMARTDGWQQIREQIDKEAPSIRAATGSLHRPSKVGVGLRRDKKRR